MKKEIGILLLVVFLYCFQLFFTIPSTFPRLDSDYDSNLPVYAYMASSARAISFPTVIPFVGGKGIPVLGDPLNSFLNPTLSLPFIVFGVNTGIRLCIFTNCFLSALSMWFLLKKLRIKKWVTIWGGLLYAMSGTFVAGVASGHIEKFLIYPFVPLLLLFSLKEKLSFKSSIILSIVIALTVYSGDVYATWFFFLIFAISRVYFWFRNTSLQQVINFALVCLLFVVFSSIKLYPFFSTVLPNMKRYFSIDIFQGSIHAWFFPLSFLIPFQVSFYDRPFFQRHIGFSFNWYEYYAFISPLPFFFLVSFKRVWKNEYVKLLTLLLVMGALYLSMGFWYSPFHWLFLPLQHQSFFRVPQRIVLPMTAVVIVVLSICFQQLLKSKQFSKVLLDLLAIGSLVWVFCIGQTTFAQTFVPLDKENQQVIHTLRQKDSTNFSVVNFTSQTQLFLTNEHIQIHNYYYGWVPKTEDTFLNKKESGYDFSRLQASSAKYIVAPANIDFRQYNYALYIQSNTITIWKRL